MEMIDKKDAVRCMQENISFNTGQIAYIAGENQEQGIMSLVKNNKVYVATQTGWVEV